MARGFHWFFLAMVLVTGCRYRCYLDTVENFTWESRVDLTVTHEVYGDFYFTFLYQDSALMEARWWTEEELAQEILDTADWYVTDLGRAFDPDDENRYWTIFISSEDPMDPLWNDVCGTSPAAACSCSDGALFPPVQVGSENQMALGGYWFWWQAQFAVCHETMHMLRNHHLLDPDRSHSDTELWARCPPP